MDEFKREFRGVWIAREIWLDRRLNALDKVILTEIDSLDNEETGCYASNEYLAEFCQCGITKVSTAIKKLIEFNYIYVESFNGRTRILKSRLSKNERQDYGICKAAFQNSQDNNKDNNKYDKYIKLESMAADTPFNRFIIEYGINIDNYSQKVVEMDFEALFAAYKQSQWLRTNIVSLAKICKEYEKIIGGYYKDYQSSKKATISTFDINSRRYGDEELKPLDISDIEL